MIAPKVYLPEALITDIPMACVVSNRVNKISMGHASIISKETAGKSVYILIIASLAIKRIVIWSTVISNAIIMHTL